MQEKMTAFRNTKDCQKVINSFRSQTNPENSYEIGNILYENDMALAFRCVYSDREKIIIDDNE